MKIRKTNSFFIVMVFPLIILSCSGNRKNNFGDTTIMKWQDGKTAAVSLTFDDGSINQFRVALPIMDSLEFPATFFIITGEIPGSKYKPAFIGRPADQIIKETATILTTEENLFERASLAAYASYTGLRDYHTRAGDLYEDGKVKEACQLIDEAFAKVRKGKLKARIDKGENPANKITWDEILGFAARGHEFASHMVSHPKLAVLDEPDMMYELEKSREEIIRRLGTKHIFSAECPYGTENERVMNYAYKIYPALRNRMPESFLEELNRGSHSDPGSFRKEYVQWQRGPFSATSMALMKSWIDTCLVNNKIWLVLVFHGVDGIGWEPKSRNELVTYYSYIKSREDRLWVATFGDVARYMRERMNAHLETSRENGNLLVRLTHSLDAEFYNIPLTVRTYISGTSGKIEIKQGDTKIEYVKGRGHQGEYLIYRVVPNEEPAELLFD